MVLDESAVGREENEVLSRLDKISDAIQNVEIWRPPEKSIFVLTAASQADHVRMRVYELVISQSAVAATVTLTVGSLTFTFQGTGINQAFPFPYLIDRGVDIRIATTAGTLSAYLTYTPE